MMLVQGALYAPAPQEPSPATGSVRTREIDQLLALRVLFELYLVVVGIRLPDRSSYDILNKWIDDSMRAQRWDEAAQRAHGAALLSRGASGQVAYFHSLACQANLSRYRYREALNAGFLAREAAREGRKWRMLARADYCLMRVYRVLDNLDLAYQAGEDMLADLERDPGGRALEYRSFFANVIARLGHSQEAVDQLRLVIREAAQTTVPPKLEQALGLPLLSTTADALEQIGLILLRSGNLVEAEQHLVEAFRIRKLCVPAKVSWSYNSLGELRMTQNRPVEAIRLWTQSIADRRSGMQLHYLYYFRAKARLDLGQTSEAMDDLLAALRYVKDLRLHLPFGDDIQVESEVSLQSIFSLAVATAAKIGQQELAFSIASDSRAHSLRARSAAGADWRNRLPARYWTALDTLRHGQIASDPALAAALRRDLAEMESAAGLAETPVLPQDANWTSIARQMHPADRVTFFHLLEEKSLRWTIERGRLRMDWIADRGTITSAAQDFRRAVRDNASEHQELGRKLYSMIFSGSDPLRPDGVWTIVPDDELFQIPFAALTIPGRDEYLVQHNAIRLAAVALPTTTAAENGSRSFIALADPVSNRADDRWNATLEWWRRIVQTRSVDAPDLPRLSGSRAEAERCARVWNLGDTRIQTGTELTSRSLLPLQGAVLHFATHVIRPSRAGMSPVIFLGLADSGDPVMLTEGEIETLGAGPVLVTLSGCGSGVGRLAAGAGLLGLTRAWLMSGAKAVLASLWPVPDGSGELFEYYYRQLQRPGSRLGSRNAAQSLAKAQVALIGKRQVAVWAAYFVIGVTEVAESAERENMTPLHSRL